MFPSSMLANLIVKGSLKNIENGFEIRLRNNIDSGTIIGLGQMTLDDAPVPASNIILKVGEKELRGDQLTARNPLPVRVMSEIRVMVEGQTLTPGPHKLGFQINTAEAGRLNFSVTETVAAG